MFVSFVIVVLFFFKQMTAYEMRISDWSSDVCSSDLCNSPAWTSQSHVSRVLPRPIFHMRSCSGRTNQRSTTSCFQEPSCSKNSPRSSQIFQDRKSVAEGMSVSVRVDLGGRRHIKTKTKRDSIGKVLCQQKHKR